MSDSLIVRTRAETAQSDAALERLESRLAGLQAAGPKASAPLREGLDKVAGAGRGADAAVEGLAGRLGTLLSAGGVAAGLQLVVGKVGAVAQSLLQAQMNAERLAIGFRFAAGASGAAELSFVTEVAGQLGLELQSTASAYMRFAAASRGTRLEGRAAREVFQSVASAAAVMGASSQQTEGILLALQQMISKGTVQAEELRGQLGERLPGAFQIAARAMGVTTAELGKMLEQGQVLADDFLPRFAAQLNRELGDNAAAAADRTEAAVNRLASSWEKLKQTAAQSGAGGFIAGQLNVLRDGLDNVSERMHRARDSGGGFWSQLGAGAVAVAQFLNPLNAFVYSVQSSEERLKAARTELGELKAALERQPNNLMLKEALRDTQRLIDELEKAKRTAGGGAEVNGNFTRGSADAQAARAAEEERTRAAEAAAAVMAKLSGVNKEFGANLQALHREYQAGGVTLEEYRARVHKLILAQGDGRSVVETYQRQLHAADNLLQRGAEVISSQLQQAQGLSALSEAQKFAIDVEQRLADGKVKLTAAQRDQLLAMRAVALQIDSDQKAAKRQQEIDADRIRYGQSLAAGLDALKQNVLTERAAVAEIGLSTAAVGRLRVARLEAAIASEKAKLSAMELDEAERRAIERRISLLGNLADLERQRNKSDWATGWDGAVNEWTDAVTDGARQARDAFAMFTGDTEDMLVDLLKTGRFDMSRFLDDITSMILRSGIRQAMLQVFNGGSSGGFGWLGNLLQFAVTGYANFVPDTGSNMGPPAALAPARAYGGPVTAGTAYLVGEMGPELFTPQASGTITPSHKLAAAGASGAPTVVQHNTIQSGVSRAELMLSMQQAAQAAVAAMIDMQQRNRVAA